MKNSFCLLLLAIGFLCMGQVQDIRRSGTSGGGGATGANPTATIGTSAVNGTSTNFLRSDSAPALGSVGAAGTYGDATHFPVVTTDAAGRVTTVTTNVTSVIPTISDTSTGAVNIALSANLLSIFIKSGVANSLFLIGNNITNKIDGDQIWVRAYYLGTNWYLNY